MGKCCIFPVSSIPSEFVMLAKYSLKISATSLSLEITTLSSSKVTLAEVLIVQEKRGFTVFQNFRLSYRLLGSKVL